MTVSYTVVLADPREHLFGVRCEVSDPDAGGQIFRLPSWLRGSYLVRDFSKHVQSLRAHSNGRMVEIERLDKRSFRCAPVEGPLQLEYQVYAFDESVRKAWLDLRRGFFNGSSLFYCPQGRQDGAFDVRLLAPEDEALCDWRVATTLTPVEVDAAGFGRYRACNYEELIDHPVELGDFQKLDFDVDGVPHALVLSGRVVLDRDRVLGDLRRICHVERQMFGQQPDLPQYLFLTHVVGSGYGGLEHRSSTALICSRGDFPQPGDARLSREYRGFLGLCSHEYFHLWNVKRIVAARFLESDLGTEAYTQDLWHYEGVTSYYDDLFLLRAGILDAAGYLDVVAEQATRLERTPGRRQQTLADASFESWIKFYQPDENTPNQSVNYYVKGALVALCLDLLLRRDASITLDDLMRALWREYGARDIGVPEGGLEQMAQRMSGVNLRGFFDLALRSTEELPLAALLSDFGVRAQRRAAVSDSDPGGRSTAVAPDRWLGCRLRSGETRVAQVLSGSPAARGGLSANDQLVALDGLRVTPANWAARLQAVGSAQTCELQVFRGDELLRLELRPQAPPLDTWVLELDADADQAAVARRRGWLGA